MRLVVATHNRGKVEELRALLAGTGFEPASLADLGITLEVEEDGATFAENARKKAEALCAHTGLPTLADDSGLEVDALGGAPGVHSARYAAMAGEVPEDTGPDVQADKHAHDGPNNARLLRELARVAPYSASGPARTARFRCVLALAVPGRLTHLEEGACEGEILDAPRGAGGFGYDPLFFVRSHGRTLAELTLDEKNAISHRGQAVRRMAAWLARLAPSLPR